uniref:RING-type domain-containing protein n=1 Tax=Caenorhabditis japonica TaxID=281687 RepID=A0A8R1DHF2_CAEJA
MALDQSATSSAFLDFPLIDERLITCQVCYEVFNHATRVPKLLPCGHNFCESCIFSLCVHQQFYLLDAIKCPTCRREFSTNTARQAPTNYDLCKILEDAARRTEHNVTVIEVPDKSTDQELPPSMKEFAVRKPHHHHHHHHHVSKKMKALAKKSEESKHFRCSDCQRKISQKNLFRISRYCVDCTSTSRMTIVCLECCVDHHNGHELLTEDALHHNQLKTLSELRSIRRKVVDFSESFDRRTDEIRDSGMDVCVSLTTEKQNLLNYTLASIDDVLRRIETAPILFPPVLRSIRDEQLHNYTRLHKLTADLEKSLICRKNTKPTSLTFIEHMNQTCGSSPRSASRVLNRSLSMRQSRVSLRGDDSLFHESIASLVRLMHKHPMCLQLDFHHSSVNPKDTVEERKRKIMSCAHATTCMLEPDGTQNSMIPLFADVLLNCFYQLNKLSKNKFVSDKKSFSRVDVWKQAAISYSELFTITAKHFPAYHPERVDILDDLAYLCHLFSDVADQNTITLCIVEATRARNSDVSGLTELEQRRTMERLELIDEHLTECRRQQNLFELRKNSKTKGNGRFKRIFGGCFTNQEKEGTVY